MGMKTGIVPAAILAAVASYLSDSLGLTPELAAAVVFCGAVFVLYLIPDDMEAKLALEARKLMGLGPLALLVALVAGGCSASAVTQCYNAAGSYEVAQIVIAGAVESGELKPGQKAILQEIDRTAVAAGEGCREAAVASDGNQVDFYTGVLVSAAAQTAQLLGD